MLLCFKDSNSFMKDVYHDSSIVHCGWKKVIVFAMIRFDLLRNSDFKNIRLFFVRSVYAACYCNCFPCLGLWALLLFCHSTWANGKHLYRDGQGSEDVT